MTVGEPPGTFWCPTCNEFLPDVFRESHVHETPYTVADRWTAMQTLVFWALCIALGVIAGLLVTA